MNTGILFPGYGSQLVGMGKELYDQQRLMQEYFEEAGNCLNMNFVKLCFASSDVELAKVSNAYTSLFLVGASLSSLLKERGVGFSVVAGVDVVSWYTSAFAAGGITLPDGLYILNKLAQLYTESLDKEIFKGVLVHGVSKRKLGALCTKYSTIDAQIGIARYLPQGIVVAGHAVTMAAFEKELCRNGSDVCTEFDISGGLHVPIIDQLAVQMRDYLEKIDFHEPQVPLINPLTGKIVKRARDLRKIAMDIITEPLAVDLVMEQVKTWPSLCIAIPSGQLRKQIAQLMPEKVVATCETMAEFDAFTKPFEPLQEPPIEPAAS